MNLFPIYNIHNTSYLLLIIHIHIILHWKIERKKSYKLNRFAEKKFQTQKFPQLFIWNSNMFKLKQFLKEYTDTIMYVSAEILCLLYSIRYM